MRQLTAFIVMILFAAIGAGPAFAQEFRTIDGSGNNLTNTDAGVAHTELLRRVPSDYADGVSAPAGATRPSARAVSNALCAQSSSIVNAVNASDYIWQWGQFLDHDIDLTDPVPGNDPANLFPIPVPIGDPHFDPFSTGTEEIGFTRSEFETGSNPRQQVNVLTSWIDASNVYGSETARALELRAMDGTGKLKTSAGNMLPFNTAGMPNAQPDGMDPALFFLAGDIRANEQVGLTAMHALFVREHNRLCDEIATANPGMTGEDIYQTARRIVGAQMQRITFAEFLPVLLGPGSIPAYSGYDENVDGSIANIFSTACYRLGHSMLSPQLLRLDSAGREINAGHLPLASAFFSPQTIVQGGLEPILRGLASQRAQAIDPKIVDGVRNFLFGPPGAGGFDLASLNIQRGRDHGLPSYNATRVGVGLAAKTTFAEISSDPAIQSALQSTYGSVNDIDLWVGSLCEDHLPGAMVGELLFTVIRDQFLALRDGDRLWYENELSPSEIAEINGTTLGDIIKRNTDIDEIAASVFVVSTPEFIRGDCDGDSFTNVSDVVFFLQFLFAGGPESACPNACDSNGNKSLGIPDAVYTLQFLFLGGQAPPAPHPLCASTPQDIDELPCYEVPGCP